MALNSLHCAEVPLRNCALTHSLTYYVVIVCPMHCIAALDSITSRVRYPVSVLRPECEKLQMAITQQLVIRLTSCLGLGWGF